MRVAAFALTAAMLACWAVEAPAFQGERCGDWPAWPYDEFPDVDSSLRIDVAHGDLSLNEEPLDLTRLSKVLRRAGSEPRQPATILFLAMDVDCALVDRVRALIAETMRCDRGLCVEIHDQPVPPGARPDEPLIRH